MSTQSTETNGSIPEFTIGDRLRKARERTGLEQEPFADEIGVSRGTIRNYETGATRHLKPIVLRAWALRTGVPLSWIETGVAPTTNGPRPTLTGGGGGIGTDSVFGRIPPTKLIQWGHAA